MDNFNIFTQIHHSLYRKTFPTFSIPTRTIPDHELVLVVSGGGEITIDKRKYKAEEGTLFHFLPGVPHSITTDDNNPMSFYAIHFDTFKVTIESFPEKFSPPIEEFSIPSGFVVIKSLFKNINFQRRNRLYGYNLVTSSLFGQLLFEIIKNTKSSPFNSSSMKKAEDIITYIHENIEKKLSLNDIAEEFSLNGAYLSHFFKTATGYNITEFINRQKIEKAKELIIEGRYKIKEIASFLGFDDPYYFSRVFKSVEGISPATFYKKYIN